MALIKISALPATSAVLATDLFPKVNLLPAPVTQKATVTQLMVFIQQNFAMVYACTTNPNTEAISGYFGSVAIGTANSTVWQQQAAGYVNNGWVQIIGA
jgi:hypothetical protein